MTAKEFLESKEPNTIIVPEEWLIEFAKYHVQKALELASQEGKSYVIGGLVSEIDKDSIINAYPLENIK